MILASVNRNREFIQSNQGPMTATNITTNKITITDVMLHFSNTIILYLTL